MKTVQALLKSAEEILHIFNTKKIDTEWSFEQYKPKDTKSFGTQF